MLRTLVLAGCFLLPATAAAQPGFPRVDLYVSPDGNDTWSEWWTRHLQPDIVLPADSALLSALRDEPCGFDDEPFLNPDQSGSARCSQSAWRGTLLAALDPGSRDEVYAAAVAFTDFQLRYRHAFYYGLDGKLLTASEAPWWRQGPKGWDGAIKRPSGSPYQFETTQHLAPDRFLCLAAGWGDPVAKLYARAYTECVLTRPECKGAVADDQRSHGYTLRLLALRLLTDPDNSDYQQALVRTISGLRAANGFAPGGTYPYPSRNPPKTGKWPYGWPSASDWNAYSKLNGLVLPPDLKAPLAGETCDHLRTWLTQKAKSLGLPGDRFTDGKGGLWDGWRAVALFQCGVLLHGLIAVRDVPAAAALVPDIDALIKHVTACITVSGTLGGTHPADGPVVADPFVYSYAAYAPWRCMPWLTSAGGPIKNGAITWLAAPLLLVGRKDLAKEIWERTDWPSPRDPEVFGAACYKEFS